MYKASDGSGTTGIKLEIYYDSTLVTPVSVEDQLTASLISTNTLGQDLSDESNTDSDESTDKYIGLDWGDLFGNWAGGTDPLTLANVKFKIAEGADLSSAATSIRIESSETASGYNFYGKDLILDSSLIDSEDIGDPVDEPVEEPVIEEPVSRDPIDIPDRDSFPDIGPSPGGGGGGFAPFDPTLSLIHI